MEFQILMNRIQSTVGRTVLLVILALAGISCERNIDLNLPPPQPHLVVYGVVEPDSLIKVSISRNSAYFDPVDLNAVLNLLDYSATITVQSTDSLGQTELDTLKPLLFPALPILQYWTVFNYQGTKIRGRHNQTYQIHILHPDHEIVGETKVPVPSRIDSLWVRSRAFLQKQANPSSQPTARDSQLVQLFYRYRDPQAPGDHVRVFSRIQNEDQWSTAFNSVYDDQFFNGQSLDFVLPRGKEAYLFNDSTTFDEFGLFRAGDSIQIKWASIDRTNFLFWSGLAQATGGSGGPFGAQPVVTTNLRALRGRVLGLWAGYGSVHYSFKVPERP
ncbi:MAG: DUF4249 domain-containing protein [Bacteroidia bacterium]|nr:DUF4249 domain-containing protein [Bacteroidia bacterium]